MKNSCTVLANAKININLEVLGKRGDGYHNISSVMQSITLCDKIQLNLSDVSGVRIITQNIEIDGNNLALMAAQSFLNKIGSEIGIEIALEKNIPLSAGLGGGSADAAAVLSGLNYMFGKPLGYEQLCEIAVNLGADIPFCIKGGIQLAEGLGEILTPLPINCDYNVIIIKQHKKQSTGHMYGLLDGKDRQKTSAEIVINALKEKNMQALRKNCLNDFLSVSEDKIEQSEICQKLYENGAFLAGLSGSGPTVFGLFENQPGRLFADELKSMYKEVYFCKTCNVGSTIE